MYKDYREPNGIDDIQKRIREQMEADFQRRMKTGFAVPLGGERPTSADEYFGTKMPEIFSAPTPKEVTDSFMPKPEAKNEQRQMFAQALSALSKTPQQQAPNFQLAPGMIAPPRQITMPQVRPYPTLPRYEQGGYVPPGGQAIVGDNRFGNRKKEERIVALPDGGVQVIPIDEVPLPTTPITTEVGQRPLIPQVTAPQGAPQAPVDKGIFNQSLPTSVTDTFQRAPEPSKLDKLYEERERIVGGLDKNGDPIKTNKWLSGLFTALQGIEKIWQPNNKPILSLEEARMQAKLGKIDPQIATQEKKREREIEAEKVSIDKRYKEQQIEVLRANVARQKEQDRLDGLEWDEINVGGYIHKKFKQGGRTEPLLVDGKPVEAKGYWTVAPSGKELIDRDTGRTKPSATDLSKPVTYRITATDIKDLFPANTAKGVKDAPGYQQERRDVADLAGAAESQGTLMEGGRVVTRNQLKELFKEHRQKGKLKLLLEALTSGAINVR